MDTFSDSPAAGVFDELGKFFLVSGFPCGFGLTVDRHQGEASLLSPSL